MSAIELAASLLFQQQNVTNYFQKKNKRLDFILSYAEIFTAIIIYNFNEASGTQAKN